MNQINSTDLQLLSTLTGEIRTLKYFYFLTYIPQNGQLEYLVQYLIYEAKRVKIRKTDVKSNSRMETSKTKKALE